MRKGRISVKLFIITSLVFVIFITVVLSLLSLFFEKYYIKKKVEHLITDTQKLAAAYGETSASYKESLDLIKKFDVKNNSQASIFNIVEFGKLLEAGSIYDYELSSLFYPLDKETSAVLLPMLSKQWALNSDYYNQVVDKKETLVYKSSTLNVSSIVCVSPIITNGRVEKAIFAVSSLQPVGEAASAIREFYVYIYAAVIILILILSFAFSFIISKPLVNLKKSALKMSELDFSEKCEIRSNDEIGDLAEIMNQLSDKLGRTLAELEISNQKLREDIEKEKQLEIMRKEFVAGVSHELKTPLSLIGGYTEALKDNIARPEDREFFLDVIMDESRHMGHLINDMLDLSQLETGNYKLSCEEFNLVELINMVIRMFSKKMAEKNIKLETELPESAIKVYADMLRIKQVLLNFLGNALKHVTDGGNIYICLTTDAGKIFVSVENQGAHIPEAELDKIWERFYKVDKSRARHTEGTGIGLSIVKNILELHKSSFGAVNTPEGVKFYFTLTKTA